MAIRHGKAAQYCKSVATQRSFRIVLTLCGFGAYGVGLLGFIAGYTWQRYGQVIAIIAVLGCAAVFPFVWRLASRYIDRIAKERLDHWYGGDAEELVAWILEELEDDWHVFNGIKIPNRGDIDHIVVG